VNAKARLIKLHLAYIRQLAAEAGAPYGLTADDVLEEARAFLALPPEVQQRELETLQHDEV
jgi:hypothetical protein